MKISTKSNTNLYNGSDVNTIRKQVIEFDDIIKLIKPERQRIIQTIGEHTLKIEKLRSIMDSSLTPYLSQKDGKRQSTFSFRPELLSEVLLFLTEEQKEWIKATGFGSVLMFRTNDYPSDISYLLLNCYEPESSAINVNGKILKFSEQDVNNILGLPKGMRDVHFLDGYSVMDRWKSQYQNDNNSDEILLRTICSEIRLKNELDNDFKINFILLMSNILIQGSNTPYANTKVVQFGGDLDRCFEYNWCKYLLVCLQESWMEWNADRTVRRFTGSIAFLIFFCLENLAERSEKSPYVSPAYSKWTESEMFNFNIENVQVFLSCNHLDQDVREDNDLMATRIIKTVCEDIKREYMFDVEATPEIIVSNLKEALEEYDNLQGQCMRHLADANSSFPKNFDVEQMRSKFINLNEKANSFVCNRIIQPRITSNMINSDFDNPDLDRTRGYTQILDKHQKKIWEWVNSTGNDNNSNEVIFKWKDIRGTKLDFQSLNFGELLMSSVIDVWCSILNNMNTTKTSTEIGRLFCFTENTVGIVNATKKIPFEEMYKVFEENMNYIFELHCLSLENIDLIFFPMFKSNHHYVVCYNLQHPSLEILDNQKSEKIVQDIYGDQITILHNYFTRYLDINQHKKSLEIRFLIPERLVMNWQTKYNDVDCGVFSMYHMETYMGGGVDLWITNLIQESNEQIIQLNNMRIRFVLSMLTSDYNECRKRFLQDDLQI